ncbi:uncharacterized protein KY384_005300 [Bacidia gigantensis]|uniref:uncharacterized protein n=1 Tax=Bacidia gigantensis TaxID=2732470 RepID=UPI001D042C52|nr:uncharacterized protein KY384_005300 [Bacidia gigantensis]KAG8529819.1 hypothetical protein KY384_005300 [Bacidia gigantensis]
MNTAVGSNPFTISPPMSFENFKKDYDSWLKESGERETRLRTQGQHADELPRQSCLYRETEMEKLSASETDDLCAFLNHESIEAQRRHMTATQPTFGTLQAMPMFYLCHSGYSPIHLETQQPFSNRGLLWRAAFEDLIRITHDIPVLSNPIQASSGREDPHIWVQTMTRIAEADQTRRNVLTQRSQVKQDAHSTMYGTAHGTTYASDRSDGSIHKPGASASASETDLFHSLLRLIRGVPTTSVREDLSRQIERIQRPNAEDVEGARADYAYDDDDDDDDDDEDGDEDRVDDSFENEDGEDLDKCDTELELIERCAERGFLPCKRSHAHSFAPRHEDSATSSQAAIMPSVLSTLTTRETIRQPDGTIISRIVLKERFADGQEKSTETVHRQNAIPPSPEPSLIEAARPQECPQKDIQNKKTRGRSGWFWN